MNCFESGNINSVQLLFSTLSNCYSQLCPTAIFSDSVERALAELQGLDWSVVETLLRLPPGRVFCFVCGIWYCPEASCFVFLLTGRACWSLFSVLSCGHVLSPFCTCVGVLRVLNRLTPGHGWLDLPLLSSPSF